MRTYASSLIERRKSSVAKSSTASRPSDPSIPDLEMPRCNFRRESLCSSCHISYPNRFSDLCSDCEADGHPMFLYTIYESDEECEYLHAISPPASPGPSFCLDICSLPPPKVGYHDYSSSVESSSITSRDSVIFSPSFEHTDFFTPPSTPGSFTNNIQEREAYVSEKLQELDDYFPTYLSPQSIDFGFKRSGPIKILRSPDSDPGSMFTEADAITNGEGSPCLVRHTGPRDSFTPNE